jgi:hypothetical protein
MRGNKIVLSFAAAAAIALAGCGTSTGDRLASGALLGAAGGAVLGGIAGNAGTGAAIGAGVGALAGAATDPCDLNLGDPVWSNDRGAYERRCGRPYRDR